MRVDSVNYNYNPYEQKNSKTFEDNSQPKASEVLTDGIRDYIALAEQARYLESNLQFSSSSGIHFYRGQDASSTNYGIRFDISSQSVSDTSKRNDWDAVSKEKPESYSFVPDTLWNAFVGTFDEGEEMSYVELFDMPKWEVGFDRRPPVLNKFEVDDEKMLSYDYLSVLDQTIQNASLPLPNGNFEENLPKAIENHKNRLEMLHKLRENIAGVLNHPLHSNSDTKSDMEALRQINYFAGNEQKLEELFIGHTAVYEQTLLMNVVEKTMETHNIPSEYKPQLLEKLEETPETLNEASDQFKNHLLKSNSNLYGDLDVAPEMSEEWYTTFMAEHIAKVIDEMGPIGSPDSEWQLPILWEFNKYKEVLQG